MKYFSIQKIKRKGKKKKIQGYLLFLLGVFILFPVRPVLVTTLLAPMESWLEGTENRIRRPQKFRWHGREPQQKTRPHWSGCQRSARKCLRPSPPLPSLSLLNFLCILRQGLTVEPQIALISGSPPAASAFQVLGLQEWAAIPGLAVPLLSHSSLPYDSYVSAPPTGTVAQSPLSPPALYSVLLCLINAVLVLT